MRRSGAVGKTILVVDDEQPIRELLTLILEGEGYAVACASDGNEALAVASRTKPAAILLDLKMPGMDGQEFAKRYRASGGTAPIVVITAAPGLDGKVPGIDLSAYLTKPFELQTLLSAVASCAGTPAAATG